MADITGILDPSNAPRSVKADAFDAYHASASPDELMRKLMKLPLSHGVRMALRQHKLNAVKPPAVKPPAIKHPPKIVAKVSSAAPEPGAGKSPIARTLGEAVRQGPR
jgi:hypothetical protein